MLTVVLAQDFKGVRASTGLRIRSVGLKAESPEAGDLRI